MPVELIEGKNRLLLKIQNEIGDWSFICRIINQDIQDEIKKERQQQRWEPSPVEQVLERNKVVILTTFIAFGVIGLVVLIALVRGKF